MLLLNEQTETAAVRPGLRGFVRETDQQTIGFVAPIQQIAALDEVAERNNLSRSAALRLAVEQFVTQYRRVNTDPGLPADTMVRG